MLKCLTFNSSKGTVCLNSYSFKSRAIIKSVLINDGNVFANNDANKVATSFKSGSVNRS